MRRSLESLSLFFAVLTAAGCGDDSPGDEAGPFTTELECPTPGSLPFALDDITWQIDRNEQNASTEPRIKHQAADVLTTPGGAAAYTDLPGDAPLESGNLVARGVMARIESERGLAADPIPGEHVSLWEYNEADGWVELAAGSTDDAKSATPGAYALDSGAADIAGESALRYAVLQPDKSCARQYVFQLAAGRQVVVTDIDETITLSDEEILSEVSDPTYDEATKPGSVALTQAWAAKGYQMIYLTARPHLLRAETRAWLARHDYAPGPVITAPDFVFDEAARAFKSAWLSRISADLGWDVVAVYGNAVSDIEAYEDAGIDKAVTFIVGENAGASGTVAIAGDDFTSHVADYVMQQPDAK